MSKAESEAQPKLPPLHPDTDILTRGFDPRLSVGSARPAVFRSSTYVFSSPEEAERAFNIMGGRAQLAPGQGVDLVYSRFNHPNAEILENHLLPLEPGAQAAAVFNSGMAAIVTALLAVVKPGDAILYTVPIYGATQTFVSDFLQSFGVVGVPVTAGRTEEIDQAIRSTRNLRTILLESPANPTIVMTDIRRVCEAAARIGRRAPPGDGGQYVSGTGIPASPGVGGRCRALFGHQVPGRLQ